MIENAQDRFGAASESKRFGLILQEPRVTVYFYKPKAVIHVGGTNPLRAVVEPEVRPPGVQGEEIGTKGGWYSITKVDYDQTKALNSGHAEVRTYVDHSGATYYLKRAIYVSH